MLLFWLTGLGDVVCLVLVLRFGCCCVVLSVGLICGGFMVCFVGVVCFFFFFFIIILGYAFRRVRCFEYNRNIS